MEPFIAEQLSHMAPQVRKIEQLNVSDPYGHDIDVYRSAAMEIEKQLGSIAKTLEHSLT